MSYLITMFYFCLPFLVLTSKYYDIKKKELFFEQCFIVEGHLGDGSFGKVTNLFNTSEGDLFLFCLFKNQSIDPIFMYALDLNRSTR